MNGSLTIERLVAALSTVFGLITLAIAGIGRYGIVAYSVARRRREIGVRIAVGARATDVEWMFVRASIQVLALGAALGAALRVITLAMVLAAHLPSRAAARIYPMPSLRED